MAPGVGAQGVLVGASGGYGATEVRAVAPGAGQVHPPTGRPLPTVTAVAVVAPVAAVRDAVLVVVLFVALVVVRVVGGGAPAARRPHLAGVGPSGALDGKDAGLLHFRRLARPGLSPLLADACGGAGARPVGGDGSGACRPQLRCAARAVNVGVRRPAYGFQLTGGVARGRQPDRIDGLDRMIDGLARPGDPDRTGGRQRRDRRNVRTGRARLDSGLPVRVVVGLRRRHVSAQRLLRRTGRQAGQHDASVVADQHRTDGDVPVRPAVRVQHPQGRQHIGADLGGPVRIQRPLGEQRGQRAGRDQFAHDPERPVLGEHIEDLVEPRMVGHLGGGLRGLYRAPDRGVRGPSHRAPGGPPGRRGQPVGVEHLGVHDLRQRQLAHQDFLAAGRVERPGLDQFVLVRRRQRQAVAVGKHPTRIVVHDASPERAVPRPRTPYQPVNCGHLLCN